MRNLKGFLVILMCLYIGNLLSALIPIPLPGTIYGMLLLLSMLLSKVIDLEVVDSISNTLISLMILMFIPGGVKLINLYSLIDGVILKLLITLIASTIITIIVTSIAIDFLIEFQRRRKNGN